MRTNPILSAGIELPPAIERLTAQAATVEAAETAAAAERAKLSERPSAAGAIRDGTSPLEAVQAARAWEQHADLIRAAEMAAGEADELVRRALDAALAEAAPELFDALAGRIEALVEQARPALKALDEFAPEYDAAHIAAHGTPAQVKAYQASREGQEQYTALRRAWAALWDDATSATPSARSSKGHLRRHDPLRRHPDLLRLAAAGADALAAATRTPTSITDGEIAAAAAERAARRAEVALPRNRHYTGGVGA